MNRTPRLHIFTVSFRDGEQHPKLITLENCFIVEGSTGT
jgi:hypothetical protein